MVVLPVPPFWLTTAMITSVLLVVHMDHCDQRTHNGYRVTLLHYVWLLLLSSTVKIGIDSCVAYASHRDQRTRNGYKVTLLHYVWLLLLSSTVKIGIDSCVAYVSHRDQRTRNGYKVTL